MTANVSIWLRAFRLPLQRAYPRLDEAQEERGPDFADLLRAAEERMADDPAPASGGTASPRDPSRNH